MLVATSQAQEKQAWNALLHHHASNCTKNYLKHPEINLEGVGKKTLSAHFELRGEVVGEPLPAEVPAAVHGERGRGAAHGGPEPAAPVFAGPSAKG